MGSLARRIAVATSLAGAVAISLAGLVCAVAVSAMAQESAASLSRAFAGSTDYRPDWPDFAPFSAPMPSPSGAAKLIEIPRPIGIPKMAQIRAPANRSTESNVLILPQVIRPERVPGGAV